jgi:hypothetical protein
MTVTSPSFPKGLPPLRTEQEVRLGLRADRTRSCPFCGEDPPLATRPIGQAFRNYIVGCANEECEAQPQVSGETPEQAWKRWNTRAEARAK